MITPIAAQRHINYTPAAPAAPIDLSIDADLEQRVNLGEVTLRRARALQAQRNAGIAR